MRYDIDQSLSIPSLGITKLVNFLVMLGILSLSIPSLGITWEPSRNTTCSVLIAFQFPLSGSQVFAELQNNITNHGKYLSIPSLGITIEWEGVGYN